MTNEHEALVSAVAVLKAVRSEQSPQSYDLTGCIERAEAALATPSPSTDTLETVLERLRFYVRFNRERRLDDFYITTDHAEVILKALGGSHD